MPKETIALDIDDVVVKHVAGFIRWSNETYGTNFTDNDYTEAWEELWGIAKEEVEPRKKLFFTEDIVGQFEVIESASEGLQSLGSAKNIKGVTSRRESLRNITEIVLEAMAPGAVDDIIFCTYFDKGQKFTRKKDEICLEINASHLIDDQLKHCLTVGKVGVDSLLFGQYPWNESEESLPNSVTRVKDWPSVLNYFGVELIKPQADF